MRVQATSIAPALKSRVKSALPAGVIELLEGPWRKFYWWQKSIVLPWQNERVIKQVLSEGKPIKLELGSGRRPGMEDWLASDINGGGDIRLDLTEPIPFPNDSVDMLYMSHVLEHFSYPSPMLDLLRECKRILKPGGVLSIAVPDARIFLAAYSNPSAFDKDKFSDWDVGLSYKCKIDFVNFIAYLGGEHKHLFDDENVLSIPLEAGFAQVMLRAFDSSLDLEVRRHESVYAIAVKAD